MSSEKPNSDTPFIFLCWLPLFMSWLFTLSFFYKLVSVGIVVSVLLTFGNQPLVRERSDIPKVVHEFHFKDQYATNTNNLQGISLGAWVEILSKRWRHVDWQTYWFRMLYLTALACINSILGIAEDLVYGERVEKTVINDSPVFILGHPRTGTTHLHNLLSQDDEEFIFANTFQCGFPHGMLILDNHKYLFANAINETRPMDNMALSFETPQEDELALNMMSAGISPYMPMSFMTREPEFRKYFSFKSATPEEKQRWIDCLKLFMKKVTFARDFKEKDGGKARRLVLKSPCHCSRAKLLYQLFPKAQFIYIHRNPYTVWKSAANMADKTYWYFYLAKPTNEHITDFILSQYETLFKDYIEARAVIPKEQLTEVSFSELTNDTVGTLKSIYDHFGWGSWATAQPKIDKYLSSLKSYKKNKFVPIEEPMRSYIYERWKDSFDEFGYSEANTAED